MRNYNPISDTTYEEILIVNEQGEQLDIGHLAVQWRNCIAMNTQCCNNLQFIVAELKKYHQQSRYCGIKRLDDNKNATKRAEIAAAIREMTHYQAGLKAVMAQISQLEEQCRAQELTRALERSSDFTDIKRQMQSALWQVEHCCAELQKEHSKSSVIIANIKNAIAVICALTVVLLPVACMLYEGRQAYFDRVHDSASRCHTLLNSYLQADSVEQNKQAVKHTEPLQECELCTKRQHK